MTRKSIDEMTDQELREHTRPPDDPYLTRATFPDGVVGRRVVVPAKLRKRRKHFVIIPMTWFERLEGAAGSTILVAWGLLYLHWKGNGEPIKLGNGKIALGGVSRYSKWRALADLERRSLITVERRPRHSPVVRLLLV